MTPIEALAHGVSNNPAGSGNGNAYLHWAACQAYEEGITLKEATAELTPAAVSRGTPRAEAERTIRSAYENTMAGKPRARTQAEQEKSATIEATIDAWLAAGGRASWDAWLAGHGGGGRRDDTSGIVNINTYRANVPTEIPWIVFPLAYKGGVTLISGPPKSGKSTLMAQLQNSRETGLPFLGQATNQGRCLLVTEEGGIAVVYKTNSLNQLDIYDRKASKGETFDDTLAKIGTWGEEHPDGLVFIDTLAIWAGFEDENAAAEMTRALAKVMRVAQERDLAIIVIHHARKGGGKDGESIRGSGAILATVDISAELKRTGDGSDDRYLELQGRVILPDRLLLSFDRNTHEYTKEDLAARGNEHIEEDLEGIPTDGPGLDRSAISDLWKKDARLRIEQLIDKGRMRTEKAKVGRVWKNVYWAIPPAHRADSTPRRP